MKRQSGNIVAVRIMTMIVLSRGRERGGLFRVDVCDAGGEGGGIA